MSFQVNHRRVATKRPINKRVLNGRRMCAHVGHIRWTSMPRFYPDYMMGRM